MRLVAPVLALVAALALSAASAAEPVRVEILSVQEQAGRMTAVIAVYGPDGLPVPSLPAGSVRASLDGTPLAVAGVQSSSTARSPLSVVLMVDVSGSMAGDPITQARRALTDFVGTLQPDDQVAIMSFDTGVRLLQDFTANKTLATQAVARLAPAGDTALYDAVIQAAAKASEAPTERRLVVLLGDGVATVGLEKRAASIEAAKQSGIAFVVIGLGSALDRAYLNELASVSGGRYLDAPTPAALRQVYANLAAAIRTQYTVSLTVPQSIDRTLPAKLTVRVSLGGEVGTAEKVVQPLAGATPPPFDLAVSGLEAGAKVREPVTLSPVLPEGIQAATYEVLIDGKSVFKTEAPPYAFVLDPKDLAEGNHLVTLVVTDPRGRRGERQITFEAEPLAPPSSFPVMLVAVPVLLLTAAGVVYIIIRRQRPESDRYADRIKPWRTRLPDVTSPLSSPPGEWEPKAMPSIPARVDEPLGRVVVMDEAAVRTGELGAIREYAIGSSPLTLGNTPDCDIIINDPEGRIAGEEARLWVQRGRLVYHKLTTLSAMATEGVTSGWQFLDSGEDIQVGHCRLVFQLDVVPEPAPEPAPPPRMRELWPLRPDEAEPLGASSD
ncbi:MAG TPA: VWA domain-containing protein [Dehalococcoidia bacterium]|nr:VWA domain-containing protein [Dehalococcoidia bacterium]